MKDRFLSLMQRGSVSGKIKDTIWSLLLACGYVKVTRGEDGRKTLELTGSLDMAKEENSKAAENFCHGFVLGIVASTKGRFVVTSNRESGKGRHGVMLEPLDKERDKGIIIEFKVFNPEKEENLEGTCQRAIKQTDDLKYDVELKKHGIPRERIAKFGIGYSGKDVLVRKKPIS